MAESETDQPDRGVSDVKKDPNTRKAGDEPMTEAQRSYLRTLADEAEEPVDERLTKAEASKRIDQMQERSDRPRGAARRSLREAVDERELQTRIAATLERIAESVEKIASVLARSTERRDRPPQEWSRRPRDERGLRDDRGPREYGYSGRPREDRGRRDYGYPGRRGGRPGEGQDRRRGPGRRWSREEPGR